MTLSAVTFDFWNTLYDGSPRPERSALRRGAIREMVRAVGCDVTDEEFQALYLASRVEADRWWREEHRGYTAGERLRWMLAQRGVSRPDDCEHLARAAEAVDETLLRFPPPLLPGAAQAVAALSVSYPLAIVSDTGFSSSRAQDRLLERDGIAVLFAARVYSMDVGRAKPRREPFAAAIAALGAPAERILHIGDDERTDVGGALDAGMRAIRLDLVRRCGRSAAEFVARSFQELLEYLRPGS